MLGSARWGGFFLPTDLDHVCMLFEFRRVQETAASRLAATRATPAELSAIETAAKTCQQSLRRLLRTGPVSAARFTLSDSPAAGWT